MFNKDEKVLMIADSALELLLAVQTKLSLLQENETILVIPNRTSDAYKHYENAKKIDLFADVIFVDTDNFPSDKSYKKYVEPEKSAVFRKTCVDEAKRILNRHTRITVFFSSEIDYFSQYMYQAVMNTAEPYHIGEGPFLFWGLESNIANERSKRQVFLIERLNNILFYGPKLVNLSNYNMIEIPSVNINRDLYIKYVNRIFGYKPHNNVYKNKIIFFEETYCRDGGKDDAIDFLAFLVDEFGSDNIIVKKHPRTLENRFSNLFVKTIEPSSVPWEVFVLNDDCDECILISANSGSVYLSKIWDFCRKNVACIMLSNIMNYEYLDEPCNRTYYHGLRESYLDNGLYVPDSKEELVNYIKQTKYLL